MNIAYTHRFTDRTAKIEAVRQNTAHMMYLFWWDNVPPVMAQSVVWQDDAKEEIEEFIDNLADEDFTPTAISDFLSLLVTQSHDSFKDSNG